MKNKFQEKAIKLRKKGFSYSKILETIPVAKSTLSLWLRTIELSVTQKQKLAKQQLLGAKRGALARKNKRIQETKNIKKTAIKNINHISSKELWLIGIVLYWAEGSKEKEYRPGSGIIFSNSDIKMIKLFIKWLLDSIKIDRSNIYFELYVHESKKEKISEIVEFWAKKTGFSTRMFDRIYFKQNKLNTRRKNIGESYQGLIRIKVKQSSVLNRKISGWIEGICNQCGVV